MILNNGEVTIRGAEHDDIEAIQRFAAEVVPPTYDEFAPGLGAKLLRDWWNDEQLLDCIDNTTTLVAVDGERVVGLAQVDAREPEPVLWKLYSSREQRGTGLGSTMLQAVVDAMPERPASIVTEYIAGNDAAAAWYARRGFEVCGRETYPGEPDTIWARLTV